MKHLKSYRVLICLFWTLIAMIGAGEALAVSVTDGARRFRLDNGLTVILKEDHSAPVAAIQVWIRTGSANETEKEAGITHLIEHMIFKGTPSRETSEIARTIEASGGEINAYTSLDRTVYFVQIPASEFKTGLEVLLDAVQHSLFDPTELKREKEVVLEEYRRSLDLPQRRLGRALMDLCYEKHPYQRPVIGYESTIQSFTREAILNYMDKWYTPRNMVLVAVGDFEVDRALSTIRALVKDLPKRTGHMPSRPLEPQQTSPRTLVMEGKVHQLYLEMAWHIPALNHSDVPVLDLLAFILGRGKSSRLYKRLKMDKNLVHHIGAGALTLVDPGLFAVDATLRPKEFSEVLDRILAEIARVSSVPVPVTELDRAKTLAEADFVFEMETMEGQARTLAFFEAMTGNLYGADAYLKDLRAVTPQDVHRVAKAYLSPQNLSAAVLAPEGSGITLSAADLTAPFQGEKARAAPTTREPTHKDVQMTTLANGVRVIIKENHTVPAVSMRGIFLGGVRLEGPEQWGISSFVSRMLTRGTRERTAAEIASTVESWAGQLEGFSGKNTFGLSARFLSQDLYGGLELFADVLLNPTFPREEVEKVKKDMLASIRAKKDRPVPELFELFYKTLFRHHPYGHPQTGTEETVRAMTRADLVNWYSNRAVPSDFVLSVVGDVSQDQVMPFIKTLFGGLASRDKERLPVPPEPPLTGPRKVHLTRPGAQAHVAIGYLGAGMKSKDNAPMALVSTALSGQGGRLFSELRDKQSLAYALTAFRRPGLDTGVFGVYLACDPQKLPAAKKGLFSELERVRRQGLTPEELAAAKEYLLGNQKIDHQTNGSQAMQMALDELYGLGYDHLQLFFQEVAAVTLEEVKAGVQRIILPEKYVMVTVGPGKDPENTQTP